MSDQPVHPRQCVVLVGLADAATVDEAMRGAVGLTLRGARVHVLITDPRVTIATGGERAAATLELFGHRVDRLGTPAAALAVADVIEIWGRVAPTPEHPGMVWPRPEARGPRPDVLHLVRPGRAPATRSPGQRVLHLEPDLDDARADDLLDHILAGGPVAVW